MVAFSSHLLRSSFSWVDVFLCCCCYDYLLLLLFLLHASARFVSFQPLAALTSSGCVLLTTYLASQPVSQLFGQPFCFCLRQQNWIETRSGSYCRLPHTYANTLIHAYIHIFEDMLIACIVCIQRTRKEICIWMWMPVSLRALMRYVWMCA